MTTITLLIQLLTEIESDESIDVRDNHYVTSHPLVQAVQYVASNCLTGDDGRGMIQHVIAAGFNVYPGEQDRFGWLTGCIQLSNGLIVFG